MKEYKEKTAEEIKANKIKVYYLLANRKPKPKECFEIVTVYGKAKVLV